MQRKQICLCLLGSVISKLCIASVSQRILPRYPYLHKKVHKKVLIYMKINFIHKTHFHMTCFTLIGQRS